MDNVVQFGKKKKCECNGNKVRMKKVENGIVKRVVYCPECKTSVVEGEDVGSRREALGWRNDIRKD